MEKNYYRIFVLLAITVGLGLGATKPSDKKYVCLPCGQACDSKVYDATGVCTVCNMKLVDKASVTFKNLDFAGLCERIKANKQIVLLDCRSKEEFNNTIQSGEAFGKFKNAINIDIRELKDRVSELSKFKDQEVMVYCSHSHRSPQVSYFLTTQGFKNVKNLNGGVSTLSEDPARNCLKDQFIVFPAK